MRAFVRWLVLVVGAACVLPECSRSSHRSKTTSLEKTGEGRGSPSAGLGKDLGLSEGKGDHATDGVVGAGGSSRRSMTEQAGIRCASTRCLAGQVCCTKKSGIELMACVPAAECAGAGSYAMACDGPEDCGPGQQCCKALGEVLRTSCTNARCPTGFSLCHASADCGEGQKCCAGARGLGFCTGEACVP